MNIYRISIVSYHDGFVVVPEGVSREATSE